MPKKKTTLSDLRGKWDLPFEHFAGSYLGEAMGKWGDHVPCPVHGGRHGDGFRLFDDGSGGSACNTCGIFPNGIKTLAFVMSMDEKEVYKMVMNHYEGVQMEAPALVEHPRFVPVEKDYDRQKKANEELMSMAVPIGRGPAAKYLYITRRLKGLSGFQNLKFIPSLSYFCKTEKKVLGDFPVMVAPITKLDGTLCAVHRTYLTEDGKKAPVPKAKKVSAKSMDSISGAAIQLFDVSNEVEMGVAEGIETAFGAYLLTKVKTWATYSAQMMEAVIIPEHIKVLRIFADKDYVSGRGKEAAEKLKDRLAEERPDLEVIIEYPSLEIGGAKGVDFEEQFTILGSFELQPSEYQMSRLMES